MGCGHSKINLPTVPVLGLCDSGKTSIIFYISNKKFKSFRQTLSVQATTVTCNGKKVELLDVPGRSCSYWSRYYSRSLGIIFVVDGSNPDETDLFVEYVRLALNNSEVQKMPLLIYINKVDDSDGQKVQELLSTKLDLEHKNINMQFSVCDPQTGKGIMESFNWLIGTSDSNTTKAPLI